MTPSFPSPEFDHLVAAVCHGTAEPSELRALGDLLRSHPTARDEYLLRVELHARLASDPDLFGATLLPLPSPTPPLHSSLTPTPLAGPPNPSPARTRATVILSLAASLVLVGIGLWLLGRSTPATRNDVHLPLPPSPRDQVASTLRSPSPRPSTPIAHPNARIPALPRFGQDPSLVLRFDLDRPDPSPPSLPNPAQPSDRSRSPTIFGCQTIPGRSPHRRALEFKTPDDRVRLSVPGVFHEITLTAWVRLAALDRRFNSLFMCDRFEPGTLHWLIRNDGVLGLTVFGSSPGEFQILAGPSALTPDHLGHWLHLAVVLDGTTGVTTHFLDGQPVSRHRLDITPPFRIGSAELGNWNEPGGPDPAPDWIRNLNGALDEFELYDRALSDAEILALFERHAPNP